MVCVLRSSPHDVWRCSYESYRDCGAKLCKVSLLYDLVSVVIGLDFDEIVDSLIDFGGVQGGVE